MNLPKEQKRKLLKRRQVLNKKKGIMPTVPPVKMEITLDPTTDVVNVSGPLPNPLLCMHMLGKATMAVAQWNAEQIKKQQGIVGGGEIIAAPAEALNQIDRAPKPEFVLPGQ